MSRQSWIRRSEWLAALLLILGAGALAQAEDDQQADKNANQEIKGTLKVLIEGDKNADFDIHKVPVRVGVADFTALPVGKHWIGVALRHDGVSDLLRSQLNLPEKGGVVVMGVSPKSPAEKAGLKKHDVILKVGDAVIADYPDLIKAVNDSEGKAISMEIVRGGKPQSVELTPGERPERPQAITRTLRMDPSQFKEMLKDKHPEILKQLEGHIDFNELKAGGKAGEHDFTLRSRGPGIVLGGTSDFDLEKMPGNLKISVTKEGEGPAKIHIERGDESWDVTAETLDKLPEDLRPFVKGMTSNRGVHRMHFNAPGMGVDLKEGVLSIPNFKLAMPGHRETLNKAQAEAHKLMQKGSESVEKQIDQMRKEMREMAEQMRELRESLEKE